MGRRTTARLALVAGAALVAGVLVWSVADDTGPPLAVSSNGGDRPTVSVDGGRSTGSPTHEDDVPPTSTDDADHGDGGPTSTTARPGAARTTTTTGAKGGSTSTTVGPGTGGGSPTTAPKPSLPDLVAPPAPKAGYVQLWGRVLDESGRPVRDVCVSVSPIVPVTPKPVDRTDTEGRYLIELQAPGGYALPYGLGASPCPDHPLDLLPAGIRGEAKPGTSYRWDLTMRAAPTTVDIAFVDPAGRPVLGICLRLGIGEPEPFQARAVDSRGHLRIDRPGTTYLTVYVDGVCGEYLGYAASYSVLHADLHGGHNEVRMVVPWSAGDDAAQAINVNMQRRFDLVSLSVQANEPDPSCIGAFTRSRWLQITPHERFPGMMWSFLGGGAVNVELPLGGTFAIWGWEGGRLVEIGCGRAGTSLSVPPGRFDAVAVQVIPAGDTVQVGQVGF